MALKKELFNEVYAIDKANNAYLIEAALDHYTDVFSEWDSAPFKRRELDLDLQFYLESSADEIPRRVIYWRLGVFMGSGFSLLLKSRSIQSLSHLQTVAQF